MVLVDEDEKETEYWHTIGKPWECKTYWFLESGEDEGRGVKIESGLVLEDEDETKTERLRESISMEYSAQLGAVMLPSYFVSNQPLMYVVM